MAIYIMVELALADAARKTDCNFNKREILWVK